MKVFISVLNIVLICFLLPLKLLNIYFDWMQNCSNSDKLSFNKSVLLLTFLFININYRKTFYYHNLIDLHPQFFKTINYFLIYG